MANELQNKTFHDETKARQWLESHLWPDGPVCGHCGSINDATQIETRPGLYQCNATECRSQFTVTVGTLFERSHLPLTKWLMAAFLVCSSKKGMSALQMSRILGISYKSTWFMMHRIREAMRDGTFPTPPNCAKRYQRACKCYSWSRGRTRRINRPSPDDTESIAPAGHQRGHPYGSIGCHDSFCASSRDIPDHGLAAAIRRRRPNLMAFNRVFGIDIYHLVFLAACAFPAVALAFALGFSIGFRCCGPAFTISLMKFSNLGHASGTSSILSSPSIAVFFVPFVEAMNTPKTGIPRGFQIRVA